MRQRRWRALRQRGHLFSAKGAFSFFSLGQRPRDQCSIIQRALKARFRCGGENVSATVRGVFRSRATWERGAEMQIRIPKSESRMERTGRATWKAKLRGKQRESAGSERASNNYPIFKT